MENTIVYNGGVYHSIDEDYDSKVIEEVRKLSDRELITRIIHSKGRERSQYKNNFKINILEMAIKINSFGGVTKGKQRQTLENYHLSVKYGINCNANFLWGYR